MITIILLILIILAVVFAYRSAYEGKFLAAFSVGILITILACFIILIGIEITGIKISETKVETYPMTADYKYSLTYYEIPISTGILNIPRSKVYFSTGDNTVELHYATIEYSKISQLLWAPFAENHDIIDYWVINQRR